MGAAPDLPAADPRPADPAIGAGANGLAALTLLVGLQRRGLRHLVLCPGSRSAPLALAASLLEPRGLQLHTAIDERSAAFFALGLGRALGQPAAVATTSGTAVAQLLAAAVEADLGTIPLLLLSADRPLRLKNCGANQAVPQERFLLASCRRLLEGPPVGLAAATAAELEALAAAAMAAACGDGGTAPAGPVHLNLPFEEPLHADGADVEALTAWLEQADGSAPPPASPVDREPDEWPGSPLAARGASLAGGCADPGAARIAPMAPAEAADPQAAAMPRLDPDLPGVVVAGPWRGTPQQWETHVQALRRWQQRSGWPVLADALSSLRGLPDLDVIAAYDPLLDTPEALLPLGQVLRLGSLPASRRLQRWLASCGGHQVLISQGDPRRLDPLGTVPAGGQWSGGLAAWVAAVLGPESAASAGVAGVAAIPRASRQLARRWQDLERQAQQTLERELAGPAEARAATRGTPPGEPSEGGAQEATAATSGLDPGRAATPSPQPPPGRALPHVAFGAAAGPTSGSDAEPTIPGGFQPGATAGSQRQLCGNDSWDPSGSLSEPWLARALSRLLPPGLPVMLASSSPVRDWESFAAAAAPWRPLHGFRGASGIDGTLSLACGLAEALGQLVLVSGDLALLHDANGWLWARQLRGRLTVVLIDNAGGGIFEQLPIRTQPPERLDFERLFAMPQTIDQLALAALHGVPGRRLRRAADLPSDLAWALSQPFALLELRTDRRQDAALRQRLRRVVCEAVSGSAGRMADLDPKRP